MQSTAGVRELKTHLSHYLKQVKRGESVLITERGKPVGRIVPVSSSQTVEERVKELVAAGLIEWNGERYDPEPPMVKVRGDKTIAELLLEDRD
ncbi:MAG: type II toxin-antitoxin system prevent-host-death family antitoxin [Acidobacteria bacterium]|nr:type II toxin-antitoxin system prevent-host-death family antitoxin [Acidobacteriota bacterium]